jgi:hypothetical protein
VPPRTTPTSRRTKRKPRIEMNHLETIRASRAKIDRRISLQTHDLDRGRPAGRPEMGIFESRRRSEESGSRDNEDRVFSGMARAFDGCSPHGDGRFAPRTNGREMSRTQDARCRARTNVGKKKAPATAGHQGRSVIDAPSTWLSLVGLLPSRARLRFAKHSDYTSAAPVCGQGARKPAKRAHRVRSQ